VTLNDQNISHRAALQAQLHQASSSLSLKLSALSGLIDGAGAAMDLDDPVARESSGLIIIIIIIIAWQILRGRNGQVNRCGGVMGSRRIGKHRHRKNHPL
jgi:hypothetical protein